jgi:HD-GYP domain-containing protein (c-di-GMP phosphodiesterase class II)
MAFARPYRPSVGLSAAVDEIKSQRGVRYDTQVVDACLRLLLEKGFDFETKTWLRPSPQPSS